MCRIILIWTLLICTINHVDAQQTDFFALKDRKGKTLKTYYPGGFLLAETYDGMILSGYIKEIKNDSIRFQQRETRLIPTAFGTKVDSFVYTIQFHHKIIKRFMWGKRYMDQKPHGRSVLYVPNLMVIGGEVYVGLELINTLLSKQSISSRKSLPSLIVATAIASSGWIIRKIQFNRDRVGGRYEFVYIKAGTVLN